MRTERGLPIFLEGIGEFPNGLLRELHSLKLHLRQPTLVLSNTFAQLAKLGRLLPHAAVTRLNLAYRNSSRLYTTACAWVSPFLATAYRYAWN